MKEIFVIRDITSEILLPEDDRPVGLVEEDIFVLSFSTIEKAKEKVKSLKKGYYQIEKVFIVGK